MCVNNECIIVAFYSQEDFNQQAQCPASSVVCIFSYVRELVWLMCVSCLMSVQRKVSSWHLTLVAPSSRFFR